MKFFRVAGLALSALLAACASTPPRNAALDDAHSAVEKLTAEPDAAQTAGKPLQDARSALAQADAAAADHKPSVVVSHLAYVAHRQADLGEAMLSEAHARDQATKADAERNRILLEARNRDVAAANQKAVAASENAATANQNAAAARESEEDARKQLAELQAKKTERGMVVTLGNVLFDTAKDSLKPGADLILDRLSAYLKGNPETKLIVEGHTDSRGADDYNDALSMRRAQSVAQGLENRGISADRLRPVGRGKRYPVASNDTPEGRQQNRRVEVVFSDEQGQFSQGAER